MKHHRERTLGAGLVALLAFAPAGALAQTPGAAPAAPPATGPADAAPDNEVVVTARKREERVQDIPLAISVLGADRIEDAGGVRGAVDLAALAPGVQFTNTGNVNSELNIRGSGAGTVRTFNTDSPIALLRDGGSVVVGNIGGRIYTRTDLFDIERIEVIRGPNGVLYGQSTTGGVVNVISKRPENTFGFSGDFGYNLTVDEIQGEAVLNLPLWDERLALRAGLRHENRGEGHFQNVVTGKFADINRYTGGRVALLFTPTSALDVMIDFHASDEQGSINTVRSLLLGAGDPDGPYVIGQNAPDRSDTELQSALGQVDWDTQVGQFTSVSVWRSRETLGVQDDDGTAPGYARAPRFPTNCSATRVCETVFADDSELWSQEVRLDVAMPEGWSLLTGLSVEVRNNDFWVVNRGRTVSALNTAPSSLTNVAAFSTSIDRFYGAFATLGWSPTDRLDLSLGGRFTQVEKKFETFTVRRNVGGLPTGALCPFDRVFSVSYPAGCRSEVFADNASAENFSPAASAIYDLTDTSRVFFSFAQGFRAGGFNANASLVNASPAPGQPTANNSFGNESTNAYEVGWKGEAFGALLSASFYFNQIEDLIVTSTSVDTGGVTRTFRLNGGEAETQGVDLEVGGRFGGAGPGRWSYTGALNWFAGEYVAGPFNGREVEGQPEWQGTFSLTHRRPLAGELTLFASASYRFQRGGFTAVAGNTNTAALDEIDDVSARIGFEAARWRMVLEGKNLLDSRDPTLRDLLSPAFPQGQRLVYQDPREVLLRFSYRFGSEE